MIKLFDVQNKQVIPTEHCYTLNFLRNIMESYPENFLRIYQYLFYMSCPNPDLNPYFDVPEIDKEELILQAIQADFSVEDDEIAEALVQTQKLYETPTFRAYRGIKIFLDKLAKYMTETEIEHGRDGNLTAGVNAAAKFEQIRQSFKGAYKDLQEEQKTTIRGNKSLAYDDV